MGLHGRFEPCLCSIHSYDDNSMFKVSRESGFPISQTYDAIDHQFLCLSHSTFMVWRLSFTSLRLNTQVVSLLVQPYRAYHLFPRPNKADYHRQSGSASRYLSFDFWHFHRAVEIYGVIIFSPMVGSTSRTRSLRHSADDMGEGQIGQCSKIASNVSSRHRPSKRCIRACPTPPCLPNYHSPLRQGLDNCA